MIRFRYVAILSLLFTVAFFVEYTPLWRRVHIPFDLEGFHYPLADYAFQSLHRGRLPLWDPTIYSGLPFAANIQAALFYPPTWLMFALSWTRPKLPYQALENLTLAHVWLGFLLCYYWLNRVRRLHPLAAALGSAIFAFSGHTLLQLQHLGLIAGFAWFPLGLASIDAAAQKRHWRPILGLVVASAMCFLAGYPTTWAVFAICMVSYARRQAPLAAVALVASLLVAAIQLAPAWEAQKLREPDPKYGPFSSTRDPDLLLSALVPNYFDFGLDRPVQTNPGKEYLYLGAAGIVGLILVARRKRLAQGAPAIVMAAASLLFLTNPFGVLGSVIERFSLLAGVLSSWYFLAGIMPAIALLAALGFDSALATASKTAPAWVTASIAALSLIWSARLILIKQFPAGSWSIFEAVMSSVLLAALIMVIARSRHTGRALATAAILILTAAEYKAFGTSKRFNAAPGPYTEEYVSRPFPNLNILVYASLRSHPGYRVALDRTGPFPQKLRHSGLITPQGFDPFLPSNYKTLVERFVPFRTNREFDLAPWNQEALQLMGVRYFMASKDAPIASELAMNSRFRELLPADAYYRVFEYLDARPAFGWEGNAGQAEPKVWEPEFRSIYVDSPSGGIFRLSEQFYPGWTASLDGAGTPIKRCHDAYQCLALPPGPHSVEFRYRSKMLPIGAWISGCSLIILIGVSCWPLPGKRIRQSRDSDGAVR